ncbi:hypothetical protein A9G83_004645 [Salmonella enterica subsp. enterica serovar Sundsvall]|nr:hypothetical protein [Salmonella enterica subsp. enterica]EDW8121891.1 hypothetical protein [Salmonella enterica subsp. enterica serovar Sundsvall]
MTTITREQAQKIIDAADEVITALAGTNEDVHPDNSQEMIRLYDDLNDHYAPPEVVRELARIALAALESEPVAYIFKHPAGELFWSLTDESNKGQNDVIPVYAVPPASVTGVYKDMLNIINLLENNEWAEHCTGTVLGSLLESEITRLVSKEQSVPVVPDEWTIQDAVKFCRETGRQDAGSAMDAWNACRAAMLNGGKS